MTHLKQLLTFCEKAFLVCIEPITILSSYQLEELGIKIDDNLYKTLLFNECVGIFKGIQPYKYIVYKDNLLFFLKSLIKS